MRVFTVIFLFLANSKHFTESKETRMCSVERLDQLTDGLLRSVQYLGAHKTEFNLDAMVCLHITADQMTVLAENLSKESFIGKEDLIFRLEQIANLSNYVAEQSIPFVEADDPKYYKPIAGLTDKGACELYYPQRDVDKSLQRSPQPCSYSDVSDFIGISTKCLAEIAPHSSSQSDKCNISMACLKYMTGFGYRDYQLTHELIYLQVAEMHGCLPTLNEMGYNLSHIMSLQNIFCANVLRDAEEISQSGYPLTHRDLWLEQIGICGMYGFRDFWREDWIDEILNWQLNSGCFSIFGVGYLCIDDLRSITRSRLTERTDKTMEDGCSSHMTGVALIAMSANVRFCAEAFAQLN